MYYNFFTVFHLKNFGILVAIGITGFFGFLIVWQFAYCTIGRAINFFLLFWLRSSVLLKFTSDGVELHLRRKMRKFSLNVAKMEFNSAPHPLQGKAARDAGNPSGNIMGISSRFLDAFTANLVYGGEEVRLLSTPTQKQANDFVICCRWAATQAWSMSLPPAPTVTGDAPSQYV